MKKWIASLTLISVILLGIITYQQCKEDIPNQDNITIYTEDGNGTTYAAQNGDESNCIYKMNKKGRVTQIVSTSKTKLVAGMRLQDLTYEKHLFASYVKAGKYTLIQFDEELSIVKAVSTDKFSGDKVSDIAVYEDIAYVTLLSEENTVATVYSLELSQENAEFQAVLTSEAPANRHYVETVYDGKEVTARYDNAVDTRADQVQNMIPVSPDFLSKIIVVFYLNEKVVVTNFVICFGLLLLIILMVLVLFKSKSYGIQKFATTEAILIFILFGSMAINATTTVQTLKNDKLQYAKYQADSLMSDLSFYKELDTTQSEFCESEYYKQAYTTLFSFLKQKNMESFVEDAAIVGIQNNRYTEEVSINGYYGKNIERLGSKEIEALLKEVSVQSESTKAFVRLAGKEYGAWAITWPDTIEQNKILLALVPFDEVTLQSKEYFTNLCIYGSILWMLGTLLLLGITYFEFREVRRLSKTMEAVCQGKQYSFTKPKVMNWDLERMWNSLSEIFKDREKMYYTKNIMFQAFYRFAPKNIERILGKSSITDVMAGDSVQLKAIVGTVSMTGVVGPKLDTYLKSMNDNFDIICKYQTEHQGIILSSDCNLSSMKVLFNNQIEEAIQFGIDTMVAMEESGALQKQNTLVFLHECNLVYGVSGTKEQAFTYVISREFDSLSDYIPQLRDLGIPMITTERMRMQLKESVSTRYLGYVELKKLNINMKLYEILDAYTVKEKNLRIQNKDVFEKALNLYYKNDFYLARNFFTDVVKNCPTDQVARWYLFTSERMLNEINMENFKYGLFSQ